MGVGWIGKESAFKHEVDLVGLRILAAELVIGSYVFPDVSQRTDINTYAKPLQALAPKSIRDGFTWVLAPSGKGIPVPLRVPVLDDQETALENNNGLSGVTHMHHQDTNRVGSLTASSYRRSRGCGGGGAPGRGGSAAPLPQTD